jgi:hypothetical protein
VVEVDGGNLFFIPISCLIRGYVGFDVRNYIISYDEQLRSFIFILNQNSLPIPIPPHEKRSVGIESLNLLLLPFLETNKRI